MRLAPAILALSLLGAPAIGQPIGEPYARTTIGSAAWSDLIGLRPYEIRARLGLPPTGDYFGTTRYRLEGGREIADAYVSDYVTGASCADPTPSRDRVPRIHVSRFLRFTFEDGVLREITDADVLGGPASQVFTVACVIDRGPFCDNRDARCAQINELLNKPAAPPSEFDINVRRETQELVDALAQLRLGQPPPGGAAAWAKQWPALVRLEATDAGQLPEERDPDVSFIRFNHGGNAFPNGAKVKLRNGVVEEILAHGLGRCLVRPDRSLQCQDANAMAGGNNVMIDRAALSGAPAPTLEQERWRLPRTPDGAPDLQGVWTNKTATPLERPAAFDGPTASEERARTFGANSAKSFLDDNSDGIGGRQSEYWEIGEEMLRINGEIRTSIIIEPADGKLPYSDAGKARLAGEQRAVLQAFDDPEARPSPERCLVGGSGSTGVPIFTARYNGHYQIVQTDHHIVISMEQNGIVRIIPLRPEPKSGPRRWMGHSLGRWEGDTLVVETDGFALGDAHKPAASILVSENAKVTERFTRISPTQILYQYTVEDPDVFTRTWKGETIFHATSERMFETACHEGNYSLPGILAGGRAIDRKAGK